MPFSSCLTTGSTPQHCPQAAGFAVALGTAAGSIMSRGEAHTGDEALGGGHILPPLRDGPCLRSRCESGGLWSGDWQDAGLAFRGGAFGKVADTVGRASSRPSGGGEGRSPPAVSLEGTGSVVGGFEDPDRLWLVDAEDSFATGVPLGVDDPLPRSPQVFPEKTKHRKLDDSDFNPIAFNYSSGQLFLLS